ncbi:DinB family protein [Chitinophaga sancti]|uniref:DinB family protein n=1 Tax=Chitinophaga sancti TaxID=1004 RepID=A0A1K1RMD2_9BACT|nr:DinB family protein [Chitinophaga sancti]WQD62621.1 DinB family protein [Chitinophaga sancti]WQG91809.1 DinB family protein [Chitinophaga sancti]SFW73435.1 DinB superfamily protein [Chitinophaga sancti]
MMKNTAEIVLNRFNSTITAWINSLNDYSIAQLHQAPRPGSWSLGQVYTHIIDDTRYQVAQMKSALFTKEHAGEDMHPDAKIMFANNSFPDMIIAGPATDQRIPQPGNKQAVLQALVQIKNEVNEAWETIDPALATGKTLHPGLHYFSALEWLQFMEMHMRHHFRQKKRIDEVLGT